MTIIILNNSLIRPRWRYLKREGKFPITEVDSFMSNIPAKYAELLQHAAAETNYEIIISEDATTRDGYPMPEYVAVYATSNHDHSKFWDKFRELKVKANEA